MIIGYLKYKSLIYNTFFKKYYVYPTKEILFDQVYEQEIYFIKEDLDQGWKVWQILMQEQSFQKYNENILLQIDFKINFSNDLKQANSKDLQNSSNKTEEIDNVLFEVDNTLFIVCECFLYHHLMKIHKNLNMKYQQQFKMKNHTKAWYQDYVSFSNESRDRKVRKFKKVILNMDKIKSKFESMADIDGINQNGASFHIICGMVKADALGIPSQPRKWNQRLEYSRGESCFFDVSDISKISITKSLNGKDFEDLDINNTRNLPSWFDYQIKNGILILYAKPDFFSIAIYNVTLIERSDFNIWSQNIEVVAKESRGTKAELENNKNFDSEEVLKLEIEENNKINEIK